MKPSKIRKMNREMAKSHNVKRQEIQRVTNAMYKVGHNFKLKFQTTKSPSRLEIKRALLNKGEIMKIEFTTASGAPEEVKAEVKTTIEKLEKSGLKLESLVIKPILVAESTFAMDEENANYEELAESIKSEFDKWEFKIAFDVFAYFN